MTIEADRQRSALERRRLIAAELFTQNLTQVQIAKILGVSQAAVSKWHRRWRGGGTDALLSRGPVTIRRYLNDEQIQALRHVLGRGPAAHGLDQWTLDHIGEIITEISGAVYTRSGVSHLLKRLGWSVHGRVT